MQKSKKLFIGLLLSLIMESCMVTAPQINYPKESLPTLALGPYSGPKLRIAVVDLKNKSKFDDPRIGRGITQMLITALVNSGRFKLVERQEEVMDVLLKEHQLAQEGIVDPTTAAKVGKMLGAQAVVIGEITEFGIRKEGAYVGPFGSKTITTRVVIDARMINVETSEIIAAAQGIGLSSTQTGGVALTFEFGTAGFDETSIGIATRKAVYQVVETFAKTIEKSLAYKGRRKIEERNVRSKLTIDVDVNIPKRKYKNKNAVAVIIGNKDYERQEVPAVDYAIHDAEIVKKYFIKAFGIPEDNIIFVEDAKQADFNRIFGTDKDYKGQLYDYIKPHKSDVYVYYAGHGAPNLEDLSAYFVPVDADPRYVKLNGYPLSLFYRNLKRLPAKSVTVIIDACFSGGSGSPKKPMLIAKASPIGVVPITKETFPKDFTIITAGSKGEIASWYPEKGHSLFTYYFLKALRGEADKNRDRKLTLSEVRDYLRKEVSHMARKLYHRNQHPLVIGNLSKVFFKGR